MKIWFHCKSPRNEETSVPIQMQRLLKMIETDDFFSGLADIIQTLDISPRLWYHNRTTKNLAPLCITFSALNICLLVSAQVVEDTSSEWRPFTQSCSLSLATCWTGCSVTHLLLWVVLVSSFWLSCWKGNSNQNDHEKISSQRWQDRNSWKNALFSSNLWQLVIWTFCNRKVAFLEWHSDLKECYWKRKLSI